MRIPQCRWMATKAGLPKGWVVHQSKSYPDRVYYFNTDTGQSSWERPLDLFCDTKSNDGAAFSLAQAATSPRSHKDRPLPAGSVHGPTSPLPIRDRPLLASSQGGATSRLSILDRLLPLSSEGGAHNGSRKKPSNTAPHTAEIPRSSPRNGSQRSVCSSSTPVPSSSTPVPSNKKSLKQLCQKINKDKSVKNTVIVDKEIKKPAPSKPIAPSSGTKNGSDLKENQKSSKQSVLGRLSKILESRRISASNLKVDNLDVQDVTAKKKSQDSTAKPYTCTRPEQKETMKKTSPVKFPEKGKSACTIEASGKSLSQTGNKTSTTVTSNSSATTVSKPQKLRMLVEKIEQSRALLKKGNADNVSKDMSPLQTKRKRAGNKVVVETEDTRTVVKVSNKLRPPDRSVSVAADSQDELDGARQTKRQRKGNDKGLGKGDMEKNLTVCAQVDEPEEDAPIAEQRHNQNLFGWDSIHIVQPGEIGRRMGPVFDHLSKQTKPQRGWPGVFRASSITSREVIDMDIEMVDLQQLEEVSDLNMEEDMEVVMAEVRHEVKTSLSQGDMGSSELTSEAEILPEAASNQTLVAVVDTNILMGNISFLADLKDRDIEGFGRPYIMIPWMVLRELDMLKENVRSGRPGLTKSTQTKARAGINFLKGLLVKGHPRVLTQTPRQAEEASREFESCSNDETILQSCLHAQNMYSASKIILLTNDNNLIVKSLVSGVQAFNVTDFNVVFRAIVTKLSQPANTTVQSTVSPLLSPSTQNQSTCSTGSRLQQNVNESQLNSSQPRLSTSPGPGTKVSSIPSPTNTESGCMTDRLLSEEQSDSLESLVEDMYCKLRTVICEAFGRILRVEMELAFDDLWKQVVLKKPPWTLRDVLDCWKKHWIAVFGLLFERRLSNNVEKLRQSFFYHRGVTLELVKEISENALEILLECVRKRSIKYGESIFSHKDCVMDIFELANRLYLQLDKADTFPSLEEYLKSKNQSVSAGPPVHSVKPLLKSSNKLRSLAHTSGCETTVTAESPRCTQSQTGIQDTSCESSQNQQCTVNQTEVANSQTGYSEHVANTLPQTVTGSSQITNSVIQSETVMQPDIQSDVLVSPAEALQAGEVLQNIWHLILKYCTHICASVSGDITPSVRAEAQAQLEQLVPVAKDLRIPFVGLLEVPLEDLIQYEEMFVQLASQCNSFFLRLNVQDCPHMEPVVPLQLLLLYTHPEHRGTLMEFGAKLDEMLCHLHRCIEILLGST